MGSAMIWQIFFSFFKVIYIWYFSMYECVHVWIWLWTARSNIFYWQVKPWFWQRQLKSPILSMKRNTETPDIDGCGVCRMIFVFCAAKVRAKVKFLFMYSLYTLYTWFCSVLRCWMQSSVHARAYAVQQPELQQWCWPWTLVRRLNRPASSQLWEQRTSELMESSKEDAGRHD